MSANLDYLTVEAFGDEWRRFDQSTLDEAELQRLFNLYFHVFPWNALPQNAEGFDLGCGSGRWAKCVAPRVGKLHCIEASRQALAVAEKNLASLPQCEFHYASVCEIPLFNDSMDFGYCLGVLHHLPDPQAGLDACVSKLKPGAPFLLYVYYAFETRPLWFRTIWRTSDLLRRFISQRGRTSRHFFSQFMAATAYYPLARFSLLMEKLGLNVASIPLSFYRHHSFYTMQTDALDRFGTRTEKRFTANQIRAMMEKAGLERIAFSPLAPFWCAVGYKARGRVGGGQPER